VADAMAGVGPFAVPLTCTPNLGRRAAAGTLRLPPPRRRPVQVYANDLNPVSVDYLERNARTNHCVGLVASNLDARAFLHHLADTIPVVHHVILNLPASAPEFLDALRGWPTTAATGATAPTTTVVRMRIHVYCFVAKQKSPTENTTTTTTTAATTSPAMNSDPHEAALERCSVALGCSIDVDRDQVHVHVVRDISPRKNMVCVSFDLPLAAHSLPRIVLDNSGVSSTLDVDHALTLKETSFMDDAPSNDTTPSSKRAKLEP
jgi:tRNA (guanine37-N1)-methyltransferase